MGDASKISREIADQLGSINLDLELFLVKFLEFRKANVTNDMLCENLYKLVENIEAYMDSNPTSVPSPVKGDYLNIDLEDNYIFRMVYCDVCDTEIEDSYFSVLNHIKSGKHNKIRNLFENGNLVDRQPLHLKKEKASKKNQDIEKKKLQKKIVKILKGDFLTALANSAETATLLKQIPAYEEIQKSLVESLNKIYPNIKISFFGSRVNGLGNIDSDLDIYLNLNNNYNKIQSAEDVQAQIKVIRKRLEADTLEWRKFTSILSARKPILKIYNKKHRIDCDLSFCSLGECNTKLFSYIFEIQPICQKICLFAKKLLKMSSYKQCFTSYTLALLVIFYLQSEKKLPPIQDLQTVVQDPSFVGPWQVDFARLPLSSFDIKPIPTTNIDILKELISFYKFCSEFDYSKNIVCIFTGTPVERKKFESTKDVFHRYENYRKTCSVNDRFKLDTPMCVQDPLDLSHNVAKAITDRVLKIFRHDCKLIAGELQLNLPMES